MMIIHLNFKGNESMFKIQYKVISATFPITKLLLLPSVKFWKLGFTNRKIALAISSHLLYFGAKAYFINKLFQNDNVFLPFEKLQVYRLKTSNETFIHTYFAALKKTRNSIEPYIIHFDIALWNSLKCWHWECLQRCRISLFKFSCLTVYYSRQTLHGVTLPWKNSHVNYLVKKYYEKNLVIFKSKFCS